MRENITLIVTHLIAVSGDRWVRQPGGQDNSRINGHEESLQINKLSALCQN
jgi:hypothetical protein